MKQTAEYGSWESPLTAEEVASSTVGLSEVDIVGDRSCWLESRPYEGGRMVPVGLNPDGSEADLIPEGFNARSRVHEYGGGSYLVRGERVYFTNFEDQRLYKYVPGSQPVPLTPDDNLRFADFRLDKTREGERIITVCEDHSVDGDQPKNYIARLSSREVSKPEVLAEGHDFYSSPRLSPEGQYLSWVTWDHPNMPWDRTSLHLAEYDGSGKLKYSRVIAGGDGESVVQPVWSPKGTLYYLSDKDGWWNLYRWTGEEESVVRKKAELGKPQWQFGVSTYDFATPERVVFSYTTGGRWFISEKNIKNGKTKDYDLPFTQIASLKAQGDDIWFIGGGQKSPMGVRQYSRSSGTINTVRKSTSLEVDEGFISSAREIEYPSPDGEEVHGFYYQPKNRDFTGPDSEKPPLIVISHGGPTSFSGDELSEEIQYWTTRGIAVLDVNYRGSTGYGREYREKLKGNWGLLDVEDCASGAEYLLEQEEVDPERLIIRGGSAGGYTTLASLTFRDLFDAGASYYGVSDPSELTRNTHKFESRYLDSLIGPYPEEEEVYEERSPIKHVEKVSAPVAFFQGGEDRVVPPEQAETMHSSLRERGIPTAYLTFEDEQHGFRKEENVARALEGELYFYSRVFDFESEINEEVLEIANLE